MLFIRLAKKRKNNKMPDYMKRHIKLLIITMLLSGISLSAQTELDRNKCREMALDYSRQVKISQNQKEQALLSQKIAKASYFPQLSASGFYFYQPDPLEYSLEGGPLPTYTPDQNGNLQPNVMVDPSTGKTVTGADGNPVFNMYAIMPDININMGLEGVTMGGVQLEQPVYMGGKIRTANKMASSGIEMAEMNINLKKADVIANADAAFFQLVSVKAKKETANNYKTLLDSLVATIEDGLEHGMATRNELLKVKVKRNEAILMVQKAESGVQLSRMNLCRIIGLPLETEISVNIQVQDDVISPKPENITPIVEQRQEFQILRKKTEMGRHEEKMARAEMLPQIGVSAGYSYFGGFDINGQGTDQMDFSAIATVKIPIFKWFEERNKLSKARLNTEVAQMELEETERLLQLEIAQAEFNLKDAQTRLELTQSALQEAEENLETSQDRYSEGMERLVDLLEAQAQWQEARSNNIDAETSLKLMKTKYLKATGQLLSH
jgi:outer membrane protein TolC